MAKATPSRSTPDEMALRALAAGRLAVDPETGAVHRDGERAECPDPNGYGVVPISEPGHTTTVGAHRVAWLALYGPIPGGLIVNHINKRTWDNRPANLELVTRAGNWFHGAGEEYVSIGQDGIDPQWLVKIRELLDSGEVDPESIANLRGEMLSGSAKPYAGGAVVQARSVRAKRRT